MKSENDYILEMANLRGKDIEIEDVDFSFYFSKKHPAHGCRVKICWNRDKMTGEMNVLQLHGEYKYIQNNSSSYKPDAVEISTARYFAKKYKVLFAAVWEEKLDANDFIDYFRNRLTWEELMSCFIDVSPSDFDKIQKCRNRKELEATVRAFKIFNMND